MFGNLGFGEILLIFLVLLLLFGAKRLPELARGLGKSLKEFKKATREIEDEINESLDHDKYIGPPEKEEKTGEKREK
ncbi:MAG: twin-arginine translocase TatA/TatE family subunit [Candidatus Neomarinimicrobiota bacterium]|nr:twin-arginine translocase TatA/TatE family subunit [Candidatus Neomarinimicrobiota bacterium]RKY49456.1 MAG: twin-arginine translocase TatA/TatE family subunit [Candidatus Neomarinimicrobiota bacterium]